MGHCQSTPFQTKTTTTTTTTTHGKSCYNLSCSTGSSSILSDPAESTLILEKPIQYRDGSLSVCAYASVVLLHSSQALDYAPADLALKKFLKDFPEYQLTWILDALRKTDFSRLNKQGETYVDYMGAALYPESLVKIHNRFLHQCVLGNTHSVSNSSLLSSKRASEAREAVLSFFKAPAGYCVIFTANATNALKLIGESYPFTGGSNYVLLADSHNSLNGIREFAAYRGARTVYIQSTSTGGFVEDAAKNLLLRNRPRTDKCPSLFGFTAQSNVTNSKNPLSILKYASSLGYHTVLDAAAYVPTSSFSLKENPVDAMAVSFYKIFGYPTGIGALIVKEKFLSQLQRPWFSGGAVELVQVPGVNFTRSRHLYEQFEDGTINYLSLSAVTDGLRFLSAYLPFLPLRLSSLLHYLINSLTELRHQGTDLPLARIISRIPNHRLKSVGEQLPDAGFLVSMLFLFPSGEPMPNSFIEYAATRHNISLRTGCMCNPGGAAAILGIEDYMKQLYTGATLDEFAGVVGHEIGVVRISLGLGSAFEDVWKVVQFASTVLGDEQVRQEMWYHWLDASGVTGQAI